MTLEQNFTPAAVEFWDWAPSSIKLSFYLSFWLNMNKWMLGATKWSSGSDKGEEKQLKGPNQKETKLVKLPIGGFCPIDRTWPTTMRTYDTTIDCLIWNFSGRCWASLGALRSWAVWDGTWHWVSWPAGPSATSASGKVSNPPERSEETFSVRCLL